MAGYLYRTNESKKHWGRYFRTWQRGTRCGLVIGAVCWYGLHGLDEKRSASRREYIVEYDELVKRVEWGEEFLFQYKGEEYWISQNSDGRYLTRVSDGESQAFKSTRELFENARIMEKKIIHIWQEIRNQF
jgi:hypothetical protein